MSTVQYHYFQLFVDFFGRVNYNPLVESEKEVRTLEHFGLWVKDQREQRRLTGTECAKRAGISVQQWNRMEKSTKQPKTNTLDVVAKGLDMTADDVYMQAITIIVPAPPNSPSKSLSERLEDILKPVPLLKRMQIEQHLEKDAEQYVSLLKR